MSGLWEFGIVALAVTVIACLIVWAANQLAPAPLAKVIMVLTVVISALIVIAKALPILGVSL